MLKKNMYVKEEYVLCMLKKNMYVKEECVRYLRTYLRSFRGFYRTGQKQGCPENTTMVEM